MQITPITLTGRAVRLEPLSFEHLDDLTRAGMNEDIWRHMLYGNIDSREKMIAWIEEMLSRQARGTDLCFAVVHQGEDRAIGSTRYLNIELSNRGLEIGGTWFGKDYQRTAANTECKYLMLRHAFESLGCIRVQFKTDVENERSQRAIERLGAVKEGVLRNHMLTVDGRVRTSVFYSILDNEWPAVKMLLQEKLGYTP